MNPFENLPALLARLRRNRARGRLPVVDLVPDNSVVEPELVFRTVTLRREERGRQRGVPRTRSVTYVVAGRVLVGQDIARVPNTDAPDADAPDAGLRPPSPPRQPGRTLSREAAEGREGAGEPPPPFNASCADPPPPDVDIFMNTCVSFENMVFDCEPDAAGATSGDVAALRSRSAQARDCIGPGRPRRILSSNSRAFDWLEHPIC